jgi:hypothetical protein
MLRSWFVVQSDALGTTHEISTVVSDLASAGTYASIFCAMAYASRRGAAELSDALSPAESWEGSDKRWLVSIDFGRTEPAALEYLSGLPKSEVRVPNGIEVVDRPGFVPHVTFHPKCLVLIGDDGLPSALMVGSANMTRSGLIAGTEMAIAHQWIGPLTDMERQLLDEGRATVDSLLELWEQADPLDEVLEDYQGRWRASPVASRSQEDDTEGTQDEELELEGVLLHGVDAALVASARALWTSPGGVSRNLGPGVPGNQLDLPRGTRVFFGFPSAEVPKNTTLGYVLMRIPGHQEVERSIRFGNNMMEKVNLPVPGSDGPATGYHEAYLLFTRQDPDPDTGRQRFHLQVLGDKDLDAVRANAGGEILLDLAGGQRRVGLLV